MRTEHVTIINRLGLHARAAAQLLKLANQFKSGISLIKGTQKANAKTIMELLMLAATKGTSLTITAEGADEDAAVEAIVELINNKFNELE
ncbi:MAG: HPr family phosphocarrier protein [SAR324 cluster bacterium]|nr:HPr family phosphocarrier protein [SAR324 cluster bacterium]MBF0349482.1 HPr family phosphocarrier protein [SAR324 cluster bacterium]